jgi:hypothetical protein
MVKRVLAWFALIFGGAGTAENLLVGQVNPGALILLLLGLYYFQRNGLLKSRSSSVPEAG